MRAKSIRFLSSSCIAALALFVLSGCTIIRYIEGNNDDNNTDPPPPKIVDVLVMVELDRTTVQLAEEYQTILLGLGTGLGKANVQMRRVAMAPMYRRSGAAVPLIYGEGDASADFSSYAEAITFFAQDDGQRYLRDETDTDGENLAAVGLELGTRAIYHPRTADTSAEAYFTTPADGFIVLQLTARARECAYDEASCQLEGVPAAEYFTRGDGDADWLELASGQGLPADKIFFVNVATAEDVDEDAFVKKCERSPGFPAAKLDYIEPSPNVYYKELSQQLGRNGGWGKFIDLCDAMGLNSVNILGSTGAEIGQKLGAKTK